MRLAPLSFLTLLLGSCGQIGEEPTDSYSERLEEDCADELDDDEDGATDCDDEDCEGDPSCA